MALGQVGVVCLYSVYCNMKNKEVHVVTVVFLFLCVHVYAEHDVDTVAWNTHVQKSQHHHKPPV